MFFPPWTAVTCLFNLPKCYIWIVFSFMNCYNMFVQNTLLSKLSIANVTYELVLSFKNCFNKMLFSPKLESQKLEMDINVLFMKNICVIYACLFFHHEHVWWLHFVNAHEMSQNFTFQMMIHFCDHQMSPNDICYFVHSKCFTCSIRAILKMFPYRFMAEISHSRWWFHFVIIKCPQMTYATLYIQSIRSVLQGLF